MHQFLLKLHDKYGPVASFWYGTEYCISVGNAEVMKQVKHLFDRPAKLFEMVEPMIGKSSIQFANGDDGKRRQVARKTCTKVAKKHHEGQSLVGEKVDSIRERVGQSCPT